MKRNRPANRHLPMPFNQRRKYHGEEIHGEKNIYLHNSK
jgi:hypothetical protein